MRKLLVTLMLLAISAPALAAKVRIDPKDLALASKLPVRTGAMRFNRDGYRVSISNGMVMLERTWRAGKGHGVEFTFTMAQGTDGKVTRSIRATGVKSRISTEKAHLSNGDVRVTHEVPLSEAELAAMWPGRSDTSRLEGERRTVTINGVVQDPTAKLRRAMLLLAGQQE